MPHSGEQVKCEMCGITYSYYIWAFGNDSCLCKLCVMKRPQSHLAQIDAVDIPREDDIISNEIHEENIKGKERPTHGASSKMTPRGLSDKEAASLWKTMEARTIKDHKAREAAKNE